MILPGFNLKIEGERQKLIIDIAAREIVTYEEFDRFMELLEDKRKHMRDGRPADKPNQYLRITI